MEDKTIIKQRRSHFLILALASILLYANTFSNGFVLDDDVVFLKNRFVQEGVSAIDDILSHGFLYGFNQRNDQSYRPLVLINYAIEKTIFGNDPTTLHILNVLYFALLVCIIYLLFRKILEGTSPWIAFWIALLFAFHPIHTEVVANIKGRDEILHAIFACLSIYFFFIYTDEKKAKGLYLSALFFFLALLSKEMAVTLMALMPLCVYFFRPVSLVEIGKKTIPLSIVLLIYLLLRNAILEDITFSDDMSLINNTLAGAASLSDRIATNLLIFGNYIKLLFFPHPLSWDYSYPHFSIVGFNHPWVIMISALLLTVVTLSIMALPKKNPYAFSFFFFIISFSVVSNFFILIGATLGERFLFFPSIAFCFLIIFLIRDIDKRINKKKRKYGIPAILTILLLLPLSLKTIERNAEWESNETLFIAGVEATPNNSRAVSALASVYRTKGETATIEREQILNLTKARDYYLESIRLYRDNTDALYNLGVTYNNLGNTEKARLAYERVVDLNPNHLNGLNNLGVIYFQSSDFSRAEQLFLKTLQINSDFQNAYANLGAVYHNTKRKEKAKEFYEKAIQLNPADVNSKRNLQLLLSSQ